MTRLLLLLALALLPWCLNAQTSFTKITDPDNPAVTFPNTAAPYKGAAWIDLDGDNWPELFASQRFLFHNERNGKFTRWPDLAGAAGSQGSAGSSWGDFDNDGDPDVITTSKFSGFHRNDTDSSFTLLDQVITDSTGYSAWDCALADADNNGRLDAVFVHACCTFHPTGPFPCRLYLQDENGSFSQLTGYAFTDSLAPYTIPTWYDYDLDGDMDLFIGSGPANGTPKPDFNYRNRLKETGSFSLERLTAFPFLEPQDGQTYNFIDFDNDGDLDICLTNYGAAPNRLYRNDGNDAYTALSTPFTITNGHLANVWGDFDNDGWQDVLISTDQDPAVRLYRNLGNGGFAAATVAGTAGASVAGIALADYDNDGDLDFYTNGAGEARSLFQNQLAPANHWAQFTLEGVASNRSAIGTTLRLKTVVNGQSTWQIRQVVAHNSFNSASDLRQHFGLGTAALIDSLEVRWPSGLTEHFSGLAADNFYRIVEGHGLTVIVGTEDPGTTSSQELRLVPNPASSDFQIICPAKQEEISGVEMFDSSGHLLPVKMEQQGKGWKVYPSEDLPKGPYFVRVQFRFGAPVVRKVIRQ